MATFSLDIPDTIVGTVTSCLVTAAGKTPTGDATTDDAAAKQLIIDFITATVHNVQTAQATPAPPVIAPITGLS